MYYKQILVTATNKTLCGKDDILVTLQNNIEAVLCHNNEQTLAGIDKRLSELQAEYLKLANSKADYDKVGDEIYRIREEKQKFQLECAGRDELRKRITNMKAFLQEQPTTLTAYDEQLVRRLIEKITVFEDKFTVGIQVRCDSVCESIRQCLQINRTFPNESYACFTLSIFQAVSTFP